MANRQILIHPDDRLKKVASSVEVFDDELAREVKDLVDTLEVNHGAGLAATQVGILKRFLLLNPPAFEKENPDPFEYAEKFMLMINPVLKLSDEKINWPEACLSVKEGPMQIVRSRYVTATYQDLDGVSKTIDLDWPLSAAVQHEYDHLDGILYIDRISRLEKTRLEKTRKKRSQTKKMLKKQEKEERILDESGPSALRKYKMQLSGKLVKSVTERKKKKAAQVRASKKKNRKRRK